jgi:hypothetical protein
LLSNIASAALIRFVSRLSPDELVSSCCGFFSFSDCDLAAARDAFRLLGLGADSADGADLFGLLGLGASQASDPEVSS